MFKATSAALAVLFSLFVGFAHGGDAVPLLSELRPPVEETARPEEDGPVLPATVNPAHMVRDPALLAPGDAVWHFAVPDLAAFSADGLASPIGLLADEPGVGAMFRNNRFGITHLFSDLPNSAVTRERVVASSGAINLVRALGGHASGFATSGYVSPDGDIELLFLLDVGADRVPAFETMTEWETSFLVANSGAEYTRGDHAGNFLDKWTIGRAGGTARPGEVAAGFAENIAVVSNSHALAEAVLALLNGGDSVARSKWGTRLAARNPGGSRTERPGLAGFIRLKAIMDGLADNPAARESVAAWANILGHGDADDDALYYGVALSPEGSRETFLLPVGEPPASMVDFLARRLKQADKWTAASVVPYQPSPILYIEAMLDGKQLGSLLRQDRPLYGRNRDQAPFALPAAASRIFTAGLSGTLTGEFGLAWFPKADGETMWLLVLPCGENPDRHLSEAPVTVERNGVTLQSRTNEWRDSPTWAAVGPGAFARLPGHFLLVASEGNLLISALDQLVAGTSFLDNKDYQRVVREAEGPRGLSFYLNVPEILVREYPNLSAIARGVYPRSSGLNSRPPLAMLRRYAKGLSGSMAPEPADDGCAVLTVRSPVPSLAAAAVVAVLDFPKSLRDYGRASMAKSRDNLQALWLRLQLYSSRHGAFPESLADLEADMRQTMSNSEVRELLTAPAALARLSPADAASRSYNYLAGLVPNDEPDLPILYEAEAWSDDFAGMFPVDPNRSPIETGDFQPYRQMILLDGRVVTVSEKFFQDKVRPRLDERE